ncbi:Cof-type HAD-IIB family hydrolase [Alkalihalobacterium alkalinitrilicum]|uniref:Cof-type HAD-IIB family hydrolase n=1 Tax=Alkalihalobacterium alkalinitrilicum TaxID=427920 RepID=UPI00130370AB|nr:Cof-type HAD-IIB family hydrolase [Alkalihalobacterium alkalinitrilicum]
MKLIASDLDGTLLNEVGEVSSENAAAIRKAQSQGILFVVVSGRSYEYARKPLQNVGITCPVICTNGAAIFSEEGKLVKKSLLHKRPAKQVLSTCLEEDVYMEIFTNKGGFSTNYERYLQVVLNIFETANPSINKETVLHFAEARFKDENIIVNNNFEEIIDDEEVEIYKMLAFSKQNSQLESIRASLTSVEKLVITTSASGNLEFNDIEAQKGIALRHFAQHLGIDMRDVMAIGDNFNDETMLKMAGLGVAMGNASEEIKALADVTTKSNIDHGVAFAIEERLHNRL